MVYLTLVPVYLANEESFFCLLGLLRFVSGCFPRLWVFTMYYFSFLFITKFPL